MLNIGKEVKSKIEPKYNPIQQECIVVSDNWIIEEPCWSTTSTKLVSLFPNALFLRILQGCCAFSASWQAENTGHTVSKDVIREGGGNTFRG